MGLFSFGGSKSKSTSSSSSFDNLDQSSFNAGGSQSSQDVAFRDIFQNLFSGASATAAGIDTSALTRASNMLFSSGGGFLDELSGGGPGAEYLADELGRSGSLVDEQIGLLSSDLGEFLNEQIMPGIKSSGVAAGTLGGGRGEVAKGLAAEGLLEEFSRGSTAIRQGERDRLTGIASTLAENSIGRSATGLAALPGLMGLAEGGALSGLSPYAALSQILGGPTVLGQSSAFDVGASQTTGRAGSQSSSTSTSKSFKIGFGDT